MSLIASSRWAARLVVGGLLVAAPAVAAPLTYVESVDGDLPQNAFGPLTVLALDFGANTVSGRVGVPPSGSGVDFDSFAFTIPDGSALVSGMLELTDVAGEPDSVHWWFRRGSHIWGDGRVVQTVGSLSTGAIDFTLRPSAQQDHIYSMSMLGITTSVPKPLVDYTFTFNVVVPPVPEPGLVVLTSFGIAALSLRRRQRR